MGWWTDPATGIRRHTRTEAQNMREHRLAKREDAEFRNARTPDHKRKAYRRHMVDMAVRAAEVSNALMRLSEKGLRKRGRKNGITRTEAELRKQMRDLATASGQAYHEYPDGTAVIDSLTGVQEAIVGEVVDPYSIHRAMERIAVPMGDDVWLIQHKTTPPVPEQLTARQMDVYDMLGGM